MQDASVHGVNLFVMNANLAVILGERLSEIAALKHLTVTY